VDEVELPRDVSRGAEDSDNDVGNEHGKLDRYSRYPRFCGNVYFVNRVEHECRNRFAGQTKTIWERHLPASLGRVFFLSQTWRTGDRPIQTAALHDSSMASESRMWFA